MRGQSVILALLLIVAGCAENSSHSTLGEENAVENTIGEAHRPAHGSPPTDEGRAPPTSQLSSTATPTPSATTTPLPNNPWKRQTVYVAIVQNNSSRAMRPLVAEAVRYWNAHAANKTEYELTYELTTDETVADIYVTFEDDVRRCGFHSEPTAIGCAPTYKPGTAVRPVTDVRIETGFNDSATVAALKHEFGHTLGLTHDAAARLPFMNATAIAGEVAQPNVSERGYHWQTTSLSLYVDYRGAERGYEYAYKDTVSTAIEFYNSKSDAVPKGFELTLTSTNESADIAIVFAGESTGDRRTWSQYRYRDPDLDGAPEWYTRYEVVIGDVDRQFVDEAVGWYLAMAIYADEESEVPEQYTP